ncbi:MAG: nuclear transport factor 2 family protein [Actinobacteria bacterium]|nr:nuclear transport factor 2 family protein [Actinomycetota bacterium]
MDLAALTDRFEIDDLITRYATAVDSRDWELFRSCFVDDATIDYTTAGGVAGTVTDIADWLEQTLTAFTLSVHYVSNREVTLEGDAARGWLAYYNPNTLADGSVLMSGGHYRDEYVRTAGGWRFAKRATEGNWLKHLP